jgi:ligand-binding SRPBCC domain-containing protein
MPVIKLVTHINAPPERVFDLARSISFHEETTKGTNEKAIAGVTSGLINKGERVTWRAKHFGIYQQLTSVIQEMDAPYYFEDRMLKGAFKSIRHRHFFEAANGGTVMKDEFEFEAPFGIPGRIFCRLVLTSYLEKFLIARNRMLKEASESEQWKKYLAK